MTFSGIAAVQAQIDAIEQQIATAAAPAVGTSGAGAKTGADFASLLSDAMNTQSAVATNGADGAAGLTGATNPGGSALSSILSEAGALTGLGNASAAGGSNGSGALSTLLSNMTGGTSTNPDMASLLANLTGANPASPASVIGTGTNATAQQFVSTALSQNGKPYVWGSSASASDPSPASFDCSELTKWAAARTGLTIPDGAAHQYVWLKQQGATMSVQQALQTPGALLFSFDGEPQPGLTGEPAHAHVAISLGNGMTIEAKGHAYGTGVFEAGNRFNYAGMIPGMS